MEFKFSGNNAAAAKNAGPVGRNVDCAHICSCAADHIADARTALLSDSPDLDLAQRHLDKAISRLQELPRKNPRAKTETENTVVEFRPAQKRRTA